MTDEQKKPEEDEVSDEQLDDVAGGLINQPVRQVAKAPTTLPTDVADTNLPPEIDALLNQPPLPGDAMDSGSSGPSGG